MLVKSQKPAIAFDADGVIVNWMDDFLKYFNQKHNTTILYSDWREYNLTDQIGLTPQDMKETLISFQQEFDVFQNPPIEGAINALKILDQYFDIFIVTARSLEHERTTRRWFEKYFPVKEIFFANAHKALLTDSGRLSKFLIVNESIPDCQAIIEDNPFEIINWPHGSVPIICHERPWNENLTHTHPHIPRLSWSQIIEYLLGHPSTLLDLSQAVIR